MTTVSREPATKADVNEVKEAVEELRAATKADIKDAVEELRAATKADIKDVKEAVEELRAATKNDIKELRGELKADLAEHRAESRRELDLWGGALLDVIRKVTARLDGIPKEVGHLINSAMEDMRGSLRVHAEGTRKDVAAANANTVEVRRELEEHRADQQVHRAPRRRRP